MVEDVEVFTPTVSFSGRARIVGSKGTAVCPSAWMMQPGFYSQVGAMMKGSDSRWQTSSADSSESDSMAGQAGDGVDESDSSIRARRGAHAAIHTTHAHTPPSTLSLT